MRRLLSGLAVISCLIACGSSHKGTQACSAGVDANTCSIAVISEKPSRWTQAIKIGDPDKTLAQKQINISYEFKKSTQVFLWRRVMTISSSDNVRTMYEEGVIQAMTTDNLVLHLTASSCDSENPNDQADTTIYYLRSGTTLSLDTAPIERQNSSNPVDVIGNAIGKGIGQMLRDTLQETFSFGSARSYLDSGEGRFSLDTIAQASQGELGCFSSFGSGYKKSSKESVW